MMLSNNEETKKEFEKKKKTKTKLMKIYKEKHKSGLSYGPEPKPLAGSQSCRASHISHFSSNKHKKRKDKEDLPRKIESKMDEIK
jgi:hypothetical protein